MMTSVFLVAFTYGRLIKSDVFPIVQVVQVDVTGQEVAEDKCFLFQSLRRNLYY